MENIVVGEDLTSRQCIDLMWLSQAHLGSQSAGPCFGPFNLSLFLSSFLYTPLRSGTADRFKKKALHFKGVAKD